MNPDNLGLLIACLTCLVPFIFGAVFGWIMKRRLINLGFPGAVMPKFLRRWILHED